MAPESTSRSVGRPREFEEEAALEAAMDAFWAKGFEATSMADLCHCTGLHKGSLYQAFGDKHQLFMDALKHYADVEFRELAAVAFTSDSPLQNIRAAIDKITEDAGHEKGCLVINSMVELAPHDEDVREAVQGFALQRLRIMADMIGKAQELGEISVKTDPDKLARQLMMTLAGGAVLVKGLVSAADIREVLQDLIDTWV
ncbi:MAG: TetR/AcrR family transcriptional regulator [Woeseiaceae bacterium]|nr:TetR/AcrR family transcriptional regulator [Woeseiaceae bacterium]